jgi:peptide/nickel transport system substrate-binding protein
MIPPSLPGSLPLGSGFSYQPERAAQLLADAGFPAGKGLPELVLHTNASYLDLCEFIQSQLKDLGIQLKIEVSPPSTLRQGIATSKVPFFRASWIADYGDAENYLGLFYSGNFAPDGPNYTHFEQAAFDALFEKAQRTTDAKARYQAYQKMDSLIVNAAPVVPLFYDQVVRFFPKDWTGLDANAMNLLDLRRVRKATKL